MILSNEQKKALFQMLASDGYKVWREWADAQLAGYEKVALEDANPIEREEARITRNALVKFQNMATWLGSQLEQVKEKESGEASQDSLVTPSEESEEV